MDEATTNTAAAVSNFVVGCVNARDGRNASSMVRNMIDREAIHNEPATETENKTRSPMRKGVLSRVSSFFVVFVGATFNGGKGRSSASK